MEIATPFYHIVDRHQRYIKDIGLSFVIIHMNLYKNKEHIKNVRRKRN